MSRSVKYSRWLAAVLIVGAVAGPLAEGARALTAERSEDGSSLEIAWERGELEGADVRTLAIHPQDPDHVLAGTASGQVFLSLDGGDSWSFAGEPVPFVGWVVSDLLIDPADPDRIWAGLRAAHGEDGLVALSTDGGVSWEGRAANLPRRQVYALERSAERLFAATRMGVWGSDDDGRSWVHLTASHPQIQKVTSLLVDPANEQRIFAGTWRRAYRSDDGGGSWRGVFDGMVLDSEVFSLHAAPGREGELWASTCGWVYRRARLGESWQRFTQGLPERRTPSFQALADGSRLAGTVAGVYRSVDEGRSWSLVTPKSVVALAIEHHPERPERVFVGSEGAGVWRSNDGGQTFRTANKGLNAVRIASLAAIGGEILAAVRHSGPASGIYSSFDGGRTFPVGPIDLPTVIELVSDGESVYAATEEGLWQRRDDAWRRVDEPGPVMVHQVASAGGRTVARTSDGLWLRERGREVFEKVRFDRGTMTSIAVDEGAIWISASSGALYRLADGELLASSTPVRSARLHAAGGTLLVSGTGELWERAGLDAAWLELGREVEALPTGSAEYPLLLIGADGEARLRGERRRADRLFGLSIPVRDLSAALVTGNRLLLGTSSYGVLSADLGEDADRASAVTESAR